MNLRQKITAGIASASMFAAAAANAAVDPAVTTALSDSKTDVGTVGAAVLLVIVAVAGYRYLKRAL